MELSSINNYASETLAQSKPVKDSKSEKNSTESKKASATSEAAVVEKSVTADKATYSARSSKVDHETIEKLKKEAEEKNQQLRSIVEKLLTKQSNTFSAATDIFSLLREGKVEVDDETRAQAQKDISKDGYWGVEQTSERLFSFATALSGGDPAQADKMIEAFKKGYAAAEKKWGGELPDICKQTYDAFMKKVDDWKSSGKEEEPAAEQ